MSRRDASFLAACGALLFSGLWGLLWAWPSPLLEKRDPAPWPAVPQRWAEAAAWPHAFDRAWGDRYPWRWAWVALHANWRYHLFGQGQAPVAPTVAGVAVGGQGMLFFDVATSHAAVTGRWQMDAQAAGAWRRFAAEKAALARRHGAVLMVVLVPDKASVYADQRPWGWDQAGPSALEQVAGLLAGRQDLLLLDLRAAMAAARAAGPAYYVGDSHWTAEGAAFGWQAMAAAAQARWPGRNLPVVRDPAAWDWRPQPAPFHGDLADLLGLWPEPSELGPRWPLSPPSYFAERTNSPPRRWDGPLGRSAPWLFYHDSFCDTLSFLVRLQGWSSRFAQNSHARPGQALDEALMRWARPGVVVIELAERSLVLGPPW